MASSTHDVNIRSVMSEFVVGDIWNRRDTPSHTLTWRRRRAHAHKIQMIMCDTDHRTSELVMKMAANPTLGVAHIPAINEARTSVAARLRQVAQPPRPPNVEVLVVEPMTERPDQSRCEAIP